MPTLSLSTTVDAPRERVFDVARDVDLHTETMGRDERGDVVTTAGRLERGDVVTTAGRLERGDVVTWRATHFGVPMNLTVEVTEVDAPVSFRDEHVEGPFAELVHDHRFEELDADSTRMHDEFRFRSPLGPLGRAVDGVLLERYMRTLLERRNRELKRIAQSRTDWR